MIIHEQTDLGHAYLVADGATLYAYLLEAPGRRARPARPADVGARGARRDRIHHRREESRVRFRHEGGRRSRT